VSEALAAEHIRDLERAAARHRLVVQARRARPSTRELAAVRVSVFVRGVREWFRRGQLGPVATNCVTC
jgi:hypothetical protein